MATIYSIERKLLPEEEKKAKAIPVVAASEMGAA